MKKYTATALTFGEDFTADTEKGDPPFNFHSPVIGAFLRACFIFSMEKGNHGRINERMKNIPGNNN